MSDLSHHQKIFQSRACSLACQIKERETIITMRVKQPPLNTRDLPHTHLVLAKHLPSIFNSRCFNDDYLPFSQEVRHTEIGHLFEHILLEYLSSLKWQLDRQKVVYRGLTSWNWQRYGRGVFKINVNIGQPDEKIFDLGIQASLKLLNSIYDHSLKTTAVKPAVFKTLPVTSQ